jgi:cytochrome P450
VHYAPRHDIWVLSRFADVYSAALDSSRFSSAHGISLIDESKELALLPTMVMMDPPEHTRHRRLVNRDFAPRMVNEIEPALRGFVSDCVDRLCQSGSADLVEMLARPVPCFVVAHYLGVPAQDRDLFERWTQAIVQANVSGQIYGAGDALSDLYNYFKDLIKVRRRAPGDDMLSTLLDTGADLTTEEVLGYAFVMIAGGNDTATGLIGGAAELLTDHRDQRRLLCGDPSLIPSAISEFLRLTSPVQGLCRVTQAPVTFGDVVVPADSRVLLCYGAANRDPREYGPDAEELDVLRKVRRQLAFSSGVHHCLGAHAARLQGRIVIEELLKACPDFEVAGAAGRIADGCFVRRYESLPFVAGG